VQAHLARAVVGGMAALAVFVQLAVWGATKIRADGALLESWQPYFGWEYGIAFAAVQVVVCLWLHLGRGPVWLLRTWAIGGGLVVIIWWVAGGQSRVTIDDSVALVSGLGALVLATGIYDGRLVPTDRDR